MIESHQNILPAPAADISMGGGGAGRPYKKMVNFVYGFQLGPDYDGKLRYVFSRYHTSFKEIYKIRNIMSSFKFTILKDLNQMRIYRISGTSVWHYFSLIAHRRRIVYI